MLWFNISRKGRTHKYFWWTKDNTNNFHLVNLDTSAFDALIDLSPHDDWLLIQNNYGVSYWCFDHPQQLVVLVTTFILNIDMIVVHP